MEEGQQLVVSEHKTPPMPAHSPPQGTHVIPPPAASTTYSGAPPMNLPPPAQTPSNAIDPMRFTAHEGMVNQLAANMNTNMAELMAMLRDQNQASSSYTPLPEHRTAVDPNPVVPPIYVTDSEDISFPAMTYAPAVHPITIYAVTEETSFGVHIRPAWEDEELTNWTAVPLYSAIVADV
ncbi:hypothetical protein CDL15_Pgr017484 [Punica granatum]|uniref:Extensin-like n=1 Tax=Punica granatum TaxID=22663 RepID=A0A218XHX6_PUNGR|nr:hypothetical protein CDL15_Pgr017484 [Punica granatum]